MVILREAKYKTHKLNSKNEITEASETIHT
jgi:hypothetical protein